MGEKSHFFGRQGGAYSQILLSKTSLTNIFNELCRKNQMGATNYLQKYDFSFFTSTNAGILVSLPQDGGVGDSLTTIGHKSSLVVSCGSLMQVPNRNLQYLMLNSQLFIVIDQKKQHKCRDFSQFTIGWGRGGLTYHNWTQIVSCGVLRQSHVGS